MGEQRVRPPLGERGHQEEVGALGLGGGFGGDDVPSAGAHTAVETDGLDLPGGRRVGNLAAHGIRPLSTSRIAESPESKTPS